MEFRCRDAVLPLDRVAVMGVLNVTPDSFSDGGQWIDPTVAVEHALAMIDQGAAIIDVGGESTRPNAVPVATKEELARVLPVIEGLASQGRCLISIDTRKREVAEAALAAGASIVNDTLGEESDGSLDEIAARSGAALVVMHSRGTPATMRSLVHYDDVVAEVTAFLGRRAGELEKAGVSRDSIALDPGFGFAKTPEQNIALLRELDRIVALGYPVLVGTSRKSFIGALLGLPVDQRVEATVATMCWAVTKGARIVRVHDVTPTLRAVRMTEAIVAGSSAGSSA
ncbi:MAG: dihydropteroate synthase [Actinomycetota bacterium]|nr:dihydropteroate synthase [Actinomycetota bacterium]